MCRYEGGCGGRDRCTTHLGRPQMHSIMTAEHKAHPMVSSVFTLVCLQGVVGCRYVGMGGGRGVHFGSGHLQVNKDHWQVP